MQAYGGEKETFINGWIDTIFCTHTHTIVTVWAGTLFGMPAPKAASRAIFDVRYVDQ